MVSRPAEVIAVPLHQCPILIKDDFLELPVFPSGFSDPGDVRCFRMRSLAGHQRKLGSQALVNQQLDHAWFAV